LLDANRDRPRAPALHESSGKHIDAAGERAAQFRPRLERLRASLR
jgi:hypothetical protein